MAEDETRAHLLDIHVRPNEQAAADLMLWVDCPMRGDVVSLERCKTCQHCGGVLVDTEGDALVLRCRFQAPDNANAPARARPFDPKSVDANTTPVRDIMSKAVLCARPSLRVEDLCALLVDEGITGMPVVDESGRACGVVSRSDVLHAVVERKRNQLPSASGPGSAAGVDLNHSELSQAVDPNLRVADIMMPVAFTLEEEDSVAQAAALMATERIHRIPIVSPHAVPGQNTVVGIVSSLDVLAWLAAGSGYELDED